MKNEKLTERSYRFSVDIVKFILSTPKLSYLYPLIDQLIRAATSISANIYEAQGASSRRDFAKFYQIAFKSAVETRFWLRLLKDTTGLSKIKIDYFISEVQNLTNILAASLLTLKGKRKVKNKNS